MAVENTFNPNPKTVDSLLRERQARGDLMRANSPAPTPVADEPREMVPSRLTGKQIPSQRQFLKDVTKEDPNDTFIRKVGKDAALLAYAIPVGLTKAVTSPIDTAKELPGAVVQSAKDVVNPDYYEKHPLLGVVNLAGFVQPIAGLAKSTAVKSATRTAVNTSMQEALRLGVEETVAKGIFKESIFKEAVSKAYETGDTKIVSEVVRNLATKNGVDETVGIRIGNSVADELYSSLSRNSTKMKALEALQHPLGTTFGALAKTTDPIRQAIFGKTAETAVARMYGTDVVLKNPEGFLGIEKWAEAQVKERGFSNTIDNRQRMMQEWTENNSQWASLTPEERVSHFQNYAEADLKRARLHEETGLDIVAVKALPQSYVDSMVQTIKDMPKEVEMSDLVKTMEKTYGRDFTNNSHEISLALAKNNTRESLIDVISKLGSKRSTISFSKFSKDTQALADALEKSGYRIGAAPVGKNVSQVTDIFAAKANKGNGQLNPLLEEAKKYKSAEEFVKAQPTIYRGGTSDGKYFSTHESIAADFAKNRGGSVSEHAISPEAKVVNYDDIPTAQYKGINDYNMERYGSGKDLLSFQNGKLEADYTKAEKWAKQNGYDAVKFPTEGEIRVINDKAIVPKSQLTDIWKKAQEKPIDTSLPEQQKTEVKTTPEDPLIQEARKYKSAEEFASSDKHIIDRSGELVKVGDKVTFARGGSEFNGKLVKVKNFDGSYDSVSTKGKDFKDYSPEVVVEATEDVYNKGGFPIHKKGDKFNVGMYQINEYKDGYKPVKTKSQLTDIWNKASAEAAEANVEFVKENATRIIDPKDVTHSNIMAQRTAFGRWIDRLGLSPDGLIEGAPEFAFREAFTQNALKTLVAKYGAFIKIDGKTIPVEKLYDFLENHRVDFQKSDKSYSLAIRSVFDIKESDLIRAGVSKEMAKDIVAISKQSLNAIPTEVAGMADSLINYMRTRNEGYNRWMSNVYDKYLKIAYKGRYDWSPFFSFQQWLETRLQGALFLKDIRLVPGIKKAQKIGSWTAEKLGKKLNDTAPYLGKIIDEPALDEVAMVKDEILGTLSKTMLEFNANIDSTAMRMKNYGNTASIADKAAFEQSIASENIFYHAAGTSNVRMASNFNKALAEKYGMTLKEALDYTIDESGVKVYKNPQLVQTMREATQAVYHYQPGLLTSPLMKTMNTIWFPSRFQAKTVKMMSDWLGSLSPTSRMVIMNNWVHFANWSNTEEGIKWRRQNQNYFYNILSYATAYEQLGTSIEAVTKGRLFGGNAGLIGGVPLGVFVGIARQMAYIPSDPDQFDPKTGKEFSKFTPKNPVSLATLSTALEQLAISVTPSTPFYSLTGGEIAGISISKQLTIPLIRQVIAFGAAKVNDTKTKEERKKLDRSFKKVPLDYTR